MSREGGGLSWRGKVITDIDMELRVLLNEAREELHLLLLRVT